MERPARVKSAALRGPTPFRNCSGVCRYSPAVIGALLHDRGPTHRRVNLPDVRGQAESGASKFTPSFALGPCE